MHLAYSALRNTTKRAKAAPRTSARYRGYQAACQKHRQTIADIQQYLPGWEPKPPGPLKGERISDFGFSISDFVMDVAK